MSNRKNIVYEPPNGGWGWLVVIGVAMTNMFSLSLVSLFGLMFGEELETMGHGTTGAAFVMNITSVVTNFSGLITGPVLKRFSFRKVAIAGSLFTSAGLILSSQATTMWQIVMSYSLFSGLGLGLINPSSFVAVNTYFTTNRGRAVGIAMAGTGLGQMLMPHVVRYLLEEYGYRGTTLIFGALALNGVVGASLFQPVEWHMKVKVYDENDGLLSKESKNSKLDITRKLSTSSATSTNSSVKFQKLTQVDEVEVEETKPPTLWQRFSKLLDLKLLKDPVFLNITLGLSLVYTASIYFSMLYPFFLQEGAPKLTRGQTATCMSILAGADIIARLTLPSITHFIGIGARTTFFFGTITLAMARSVLALQNQYILVLLISAVTGYVRAGTVINQNLTISEYINQAQLPGALGLNMVNKGLTVITLGQLLGYLRDYTGNFQLAIHISNLLLILVFILWLPEMIIKRCNKNHTEPIYKVPD